MEGEEDHSKLLNLAEAMLPIRSTVYPAANGHPVRFTAYCPRCGDSKNDNLSIAVEEWSRHHRIKHLEDVLTELKGK